MTRCSVTYLDDCLGALSSPEGNDVLRPVHQDALGLHWLPLECEIFCRVNDRTILQNYYSIRNSIFHTRKFSFFYRTTSSYIKSQKIAQKVWNTARYSLNAANKHFSSPQNSKRSPSNFPNPQNRWAKPQEPPSGNFWKINASFRDEKIWTWVLTAWSLTQMYFWLSNVTFPNLKSSGLSPKLDSLNTSLKLNGRFCCMLTPASNFESYYR